MERVVITPDADGLGGMLGDLVRQNILAHPDRAGLLDGVRGTVNIHAVDAEAGVGLMFTGGELTVGKPVPRPSLTIECDSATLMEMSNVPLRFGQPDVLTPAGREIILKILTGKVKVKGMLMHPRVLTRLQKLLSVA